MSTKIPQEFLTLQSAVKAFMAVQQDKKKRLMELQRMTGFLEVYYESEKVSEETLLNYMMTLESLSVKVVDDALRLPKDTDSLTDTTLVEKKQQALQAVIRLLELTKEHRDHFLRNIGYVSKKQRTKVANVELARRQDGLRKLALWRSNLGAELAGFGIRV